MSTNTNANGYDLQLMAALGPASASIGDWINVSWTVNNNSVVAADGYWVDTVYLSSDAVLDLNDTEVLSYEAGPLEAGASYSHNTYFSVPYIRTAGQYYFIFKTDSYGEQAETDEINNYLAAPINLDLNGPDLHVISASAPTAASAGDLITLSWTVRNSGLAAVSNNWHDRVDLSIDKTLDENDIYITEYFNPLLAAESSYSRSLSLSIPSISAAGLYYILFSSDDFGEQGETNELNRAC